MRLPIVDTRTIPEELDYLRLWRIDPTAGVRGRLEVRPVGPGVVARIERPGADEAHVLLDAEFAGELASAAQLLAGRDPRTGHAAAPEQWQLVVELGWAGMERRFELHGEPLEDALRAVVARLDALLDRPVSWHLRELRGASIDDAPG